MESSLDIIPKNFFNKGNFSPTRRLVLPSSTGLEISRFPAKEEWEKCIYGNKRIIKTKNVINGNKRIMKNFCNEGTSKMQINIYSVQSLQSFINKVGPNLHLLAYKITIESKPYKFAFHDLTIKIFMQVQKRFWLQCDNVRNTWLIPKLSFLSRSFL